MASQAEYLAQFSTPYALYAAYAATTFEIVGGLFLLLGALTPLVGLGVLVQQVLTVVWTSYYKGPNLLNADGSYHGGFEYSVALGMLGLLFLVFGGGVVSLDRVFARSKPTEAEAEPRPVDESPAATPAAVPPENTFFSARP
jgi:putative oxidoreductase